MTHTPFKPRVVVNNRPIRKRLHGGKPRELASMGEHDPGATSSEFQANNKGRQVTITATAAGHHQPFDYPVTVPPGIWGKDMPEFEEGFRARMTNTALMDAYRERQKDGKGIGGAWKQGFRAASLLINAEHRRQGHGGQAQKMSVSGEGIKVIRTWTPGG